MSRDAGSSSAANGQAMLRQPDDIIEVPLDEVLDSAPES